MKNNLTAERLRELLHYDPETGVFTRKTTGRLLPGSRTSAGYLTAHVDGHRYYLHRLAWLYVYGRWPMGCVDHKDHKPGNNRMDNLREGSQMFNQANRIAANKNSTTGLLGVRRKGEGKFQANITVNGMSIILGTHSTPEKAHEIYLAAKRQLHRGCTI